MSGPLRLVMMGTGRFAVPTFETLLASRHTLVGLVTQPDRKARGGRRHRNPMKELAVANDLPVLQPERINNDSGGFSELAADLAVVAAYGQILSAEVIETPRLGCINVHASLLPKYRGAAPIQHAILQGETRTGVTIFQIEPRLDAGPILGSVSTDIGEDETYGELEERLSVLAAPLTLQVVDDIAAGTTEPVTQDAGAVTKARSLRKEHGLIDWSQTMRQVHCQIRGTQPWPRPYSFLHRPGDAVVRLLILKAAPRDASADAPGRPGEVRLAGERVEVSCADGWLPLKLVQPPGKRAMDVDAFLRGHAIPEGSWFGPEQAGSADAS